jgi:hypothetical protein
VIDRASPASAFSSREEKKTPILKLRWYRRPHLRRSAFFFVGTFEGVTVLLKFEVEAFFEKKMGVEAVSFS